MQHEAISNDGSTEAALRVLLADVLGIGSERAARFEDDTALFDALPEFDSMAVANFLTEVEERFEVLIEDHDVEAEDFETFGSLRAWLERLTAR